MSVLSKHTSTNLEALDLKIARLLRDPSEIFEHVAINVDAMTMTELKDFAENGGLGACVSKQDVLAETKDDLMYLQGERIIVLKYIKDDIYMGYCEGVIGHFNAESVHFVELDPRVLESLDAEYLDPEQQSILSFDSQQQRSLYNMPRHSLISLSCSITSDQYSIQQRQQQWARRSFESLTTANSSSISTQHYQQQSGSYLSYDATNQNQQEQVYDTSAFNIDYSDDDDDEEQFYNTQPPQTPLPLSATSPLQKHVPFESDHTTTDDEADELYQQKHFSKTINTTTLANNSNVIYLPNKFTNNIHNNNNINNDKHVDEFGFLLASKKSLSSTKSNLSSSNKKTLKEYRDLEIKWINVVSKLDVGTVKKDAKLKKLVRSGIPTSVRPKVWQLLAGVNDLKKKDKFKSLLAMPATKIYDVINRDIPRCYPDHVQFIEESGQGQRDLSAVLKAYSQYNPELEYCQGMGRLAGLMLMHMSVEDSFWLMVATIDRYMNGYFTPTLSQLRIDAYIIGQLLHDHNPKLAQHLESNDVTPIMYIAQWFLTAFTMTLPWESVLRVWDCFYFEGIKVFYRVSLAIMDLCKDHLLQSCPTNSELLGFLLHIPHSYLQPDTLLDAAFGIPLSKTDIKKYAKKAGDDDASVTGLPFEDGIKNLQVNGSAAGLGGLKQLKIKKK